MSDNSDRESIIQELVLITNYSRQYYDLKTDEQLQEELRRAYGE